MYAIHFSGWKNLHNPFVVHFIILWLFCKMYCGIYEHMRNVLNFWVYAIYGKPRKWIKKRSNLCFIVQCKIAFYVFAWSNFAKRFFVWRTTTTKEACDVFRTKSTNLVCVYIKIHMLPAQNVRISPPKSCKVHCFMHFFAQKERYKNYHSARHKFIYSKLR